MKKSKKSALMLLLISAIFMTNYRVVLANSNEPIMEYKYTVEEQKIKRAHFIWKACIEELRNDKVFTDEQAKKVNVYLNEAMKCKKKSEWRQDKYDRQKNVLKLSTIDNMVKDNVITEKQAGELKVKFSKYDLSNLDK